MADPDTPSSDHAAMSDYWTMVATILDGTKAMRAAGTKYLPKFENETDKDYAFRRENAKFTNIYRDIVENLAAKPFTKEVMVDEKSISAKLKELIEDIDGRGNHLHIFAQRLFFDGINNAIDWILVDKTRLPPGTISRADEMAIGARPYWVRIPAIRMLAVYSESIKGKEEIVHARILEPVTVRDGYSEKVIRRVRIFDRAVTMDGDRAVAAGVPTFQLLEERTTAGGQKEWVPIADGVLSIDAIPLVPFITGRRKDTSWQFVPPMQDCADLQIEHFQQESGLKNATDNTAFPMLSGNGVSPPKKEDGPLLIGPKRVLFAPPQADGTVGTFQFIEPQGSSLKFLDERVDNTEQQMRELGRQPLTAQTGNLTVVTTAFAAQKGNSAIQAWCFNLKDALENALKLTSKWLGENAESKPQVTVHTDFGIALEGEGVLGTLQAAREAKDISREAYLEELQRRDVLKPEYDAEADLEKILKEGPADDETTPPSDGGGP